MVARDPSLRHMLALHQPNDSYLFQQLRTNTVESRSSYFQKRFPVTQNTRPGTHYCLLITTATVRSVSIMLQLYSPYILTRSGMQL